MKNTIKKYYFILLTFSLILILIDCFVIDTKVFNDQLISQDDNLVFSNCFEVSHVDVSEDNLFIDSSIIKTNRLCNSTKIFTGFVVKVKSCYIIHIWRPPKVSNLFIVI